ncbi:aspartate aminotransferase family protein [Bartonella vinsonii]|uniref:Acetylornithine aminotransferase n=1 Tax=Bartonella vinsonii subsp. berkhoffii str. Tweed TaxID=1094502 RepID=N6VQM7_BARVB|nr:aspartate aminotransferase family protein [Bartonella vinsonii]AGF75254.1 bifunctional N-succinyldiaminopimelate- aminotransferase/acetylornithine transaminase protein [Bartonella vinsonii subsp. berkhoffii str. Winnie]ENN95446.1 bifunctional N-succinyldiaminopimelate-aminotransferase/acetylornithine transaminase protein [Bartonella vinsonii subsp. berkhoffii str. Tweed]
MGTTTIQPLYKCFARRNLHFKKGNGIWLTSDKGELYLDMTSGIGVNALGYAHPKLVETLKIQAEKLWHISNLFQSPEQEALAARLCANSFADKVFFCNSGAEALECAFKTARHAHYASGHPTRVEIIAFEGAFHGRTLATLAATGQEKYLEGFGPKTSGFIQIPFCDKSALRNVINKNTAAILIEPIQGEGGIRIVSPEYLKFLRKICDENNLFLILDEVQTGIGRTGKFFAYAWSEIKPDILTLAKGLGGGFPLGACLATNEAAKSMTPGTHGSTFGGNLLGMAVSNSVLDIILEPSFLHHVQQMGDKLKSGLSDILNIYPDIICSIQSVGLMIGIQCVVPSNAVVNALEKEYVLSVGANNNVVRLLPPLIIKEEEVEESLYRIEKAIASLSRTNKKRQGL